MRIDKISRPFGPSTGHRHNERVKDSFYQTSRWKSTRNAFIAAHPKCEQCGSPATVADHRKRRKEGGADYDWSNLAALCAPCHNKKDNNSGR